MAERAAKSALGLADAIRRGEEEGDPSAVWLAADRETETRADRIALYGHAMIHAGYVTGGAKRKPYTACLVCGADLS